MSDVIKLRASSFGSCVKAQVAVELGFGAQAPNDTMQGYFDRGTAHEDECIAAMRAEGWLIVDQQREVTMEPVAGVVIVGHLDGRCMHPDDPRWRVLEIKRGTGYDAFEKAAKTDDWSAPLASRYGWQSSVYMGAVDEEMVVARLNEDGAVEWFVEELPPFKGVDVASRAREIHSWVMLGTLPDACSQKDYPCPVSYLHDDEKPVVEDDPELDAIADEYRRWAQMEKTAKLAKEKARDELLERGSVTTADWKVTVFEATNPARWDEDTLVARYGEDVMTCKIPGGKSPRVKVTKQGEK